MAETEKIRIPVYILVILFGMGSWIAVNGLWVELPLLVQDLPEAWNLPSYLVIIIQIANIGPLAYSVVRKFCRSHQLLEDITVYILVLLGAAACMLLAFFWRTTVVISGQLHSIALLTLAFFLASVDCTSSVVFLPFMSRLKARYMTAMFIGEGLSGLVPGLVALAQGASGSDRCENKTITNSTTGENSTILVPVSSPPLFSVDVFFVVLFLMMLVCGGAYILLNYLPLCKTEHVRTDSQQSSASSSNENMQVRKVVYKHVRSDDVHCEKNLSLDDPFPSSQEPLHIEPDTSRSAIIFLLFITAWVSAIGNGLLPAIQSYSALPYGQTSYHLAVTLSSIANPLTCFLMFLVPCPSKKVVSMLTVGGTAFVAYIFYLALTSPSPPLSHLLIGQIIMVSVWIVNTAVISCVKVSIAAILRLQAKSALFWYGVSEQCGSLVGAVIAFMLVNTFRLFTSKAPCT